MNSGTRTRVARAGAIATVLVLASSCGDKRTTHDARAVVHAFGQEGIRLADGRGSGKASDRAATLTGDVDGFVIVLVEPSSAYAKHVVRPLQAKRARGLLLLKDNVVVVASSAMPHVPAFRNDARAAVPLDLDDLRVKREREVDPLCC
jgi:hypothetical protein